MSAPHARLPAPIGATHPAVLDRRMRDLLALGASCLIPLLIALGISLTVPNPSLGLLFGLTLGAAGVFVLVLNSRLEVTVALVALYLGLLYGPIKLGSGGHELASVSRDVMIFAVALGAFLRILVKGERIRLPPLSGWVLLFVALVLVEAFNPNTHGIAKVLGGYRQQLEWVPFFFFGYAIMRSKQRLRKFFIILGVIALANGVVSTYQTRLSPSQLATWGPGYRELVEGTQVQGQKGGISARAYVVEGVARVRPPALGSDAGFSGGLGVLALPCALALLAIAGRGRRWVGMLLCLGALLGVVTGLGRFQVVGAVFSVLVFALLASTAGRQVQRRLMALLWVLVLAIPLGVVLVSIEAKGTFNRYAEIAPGNVASAKDKKTGELTHLPNQLAVAPFGVGLGSAGAAAGFGGKVKEELEGHGVGSETQYNFLADELGLPGILLWAGLALNLMGLTVRRLRRIADIELRIALAGVFSSIVALFFVGVSGPVMGSAAAGPYFWFAAGIAGYWFVGPGRKLAAAKAGTA
jgi:hypothetical protein